MIPGMEMNEASPSNINKILYINWFLWRKKIEINIMKLKKNMNVSFWLLDAEFNIYN